MNVGEWSLKRARLWPERPFLKQGDLLLTNREFNDRVNRAANVLLARGVRQGDRVATVMVNCSAFIELYFACAKIGAVIVPVNHHLAVPELAQILTDCGPGVVMYSPGFTPAVEELRAGGGRADWLRHAGDTQAAAAGFDDPADPRAAAEPEVPWEVELEDPLLIMFTSGTTGSLKGAVLSHNNFLFGAIQNLLFGVNAGFKSLVVAPLFHIGALVASMTPVVYAGGALVIRDFDNPSEIIRLIMAEKINYMFAVPAMFKMMSKAPGWEEADFSHVHFFIAGGAPMPVPLIQQYQEEKGVRFVQGYGMTETLRISSLDPEDGRRKAGSIGKELFHTSVRIVGDDGVEVPPEETGEIVVKGPAVFSRYWNNPVATAAAIRDGWFHTGDLGRRDAEGFIYIVGRKSDLIICAGKNVYAAEVERAIEALPEVSEAAVVGMADATRGEVPAAFVALKTSGVLTAEDVAAALKPRLAAYKLPKKIVFLDALPRTGSGKVAKNELKQQLNP
ncbi:MAG TPA: long-chain fatty acid--CoA ligase [Desulfobacterales bacterium]|nr:long-chain fatty acid--CoA ligase [Desulfobacterales bacterium]